MPFSLRSAFYIAQTFILYYHMPSIKAIAGFFKITGIENFIRRIAQVQSSYASRPGQKLHKKDEI